MTNGLRSPWSKASRAFSPKPVTCTSSLPDAFRDGSRLSPDHPLPDIEIQPAHWAIVQTILARHVPGYEVRAFGSRARKQARRHSDLDLAIITDEPLPRSTPALFSGAGLGVMAFGDMVQVSLVRFVMTCWPPPRADANDCQPDHQGHGNECRISTASAGIGLAHHRPCPSRQPQIGQRDRQQHAQPLHQPSLTLCLVIPDHVLV